MKAKTPIKLVSCMLSLSRNRLISELQNMPEDAVIQLMIDIYPPYHILGKEKRFLARIEYDRTTNFIILSGD